MTELSKYIPEQEERVFLPNVPEIAGYHKLVKGTVSGIDWMLERHYQYLWDVRDVLMGNPLGTLWDCDEDEMFLPNLHTNSKVSKRWHAIVLNPEDVYDAVYQHLQIIKNLKISVNYKTQHRAGFKQSWFGCSLGFFIDRPQKPQKHWPGSPSIITNNWSTYAQFVARYLFPDWDGPE